MLLVFLVIVALAPVDSDSWQQTYLVVNLVTIGFLNLFSGVFQVFITLFIKCFEEYIQIEIHHLICFER